MMVDYEYPFTTETGETILNDKFLIDFIRVKCGDEIADHVAEKIDLERIPVKVKGRLSKLHKLISDIEDEVQNIGEAVEKTLETIERTQAGK